MRTVIACLVCVAALLVGSVDAWGKGGKGGGKGGGFSGGRGPSTRPSFGPKQTVKKEQYQRKPATKDVANKQVAKGDKHLPGDKKLTKEERLQRKRLTNDPAGDDILNDDDGATSAGQGKGIGREVSELAKQGVRGQDLKQEIQRLQQEHGIAQGRFRDQLPIDGGGDGIDVGDGGGEVIDPE